MKPVNYTSSLPSELLKMLEHYAVRFKVPKNRIIENSLKAYFDSIKKAEYTRSFKKAAGDPEIVDMAEEGLEDYLKILDEP
ncbi:MAG: CopG family transcriptional regulator [Porphyromonadaceae bacterium]|nr:MAG: CopG family transcriptional regulator [Porphyromonadaceae bacterium]